MSGIVLEKTEIWPTILRQVSSNQEENFLLSIDVAMGRGMDGEAPQTHTPQANEKRTLKIRNKGCKG